MSEDFSSKFVLANGKLDEFALADFIIKKHNIVTCHGIVRNTDGTLDESVIKKDIAQKLEFLGYKSGSAQKIENIFRLCKVRSAITKLSTAENQIPLQNGTITVDLKNAGMTFDDEKYPSPYRLNVSLNTEISNEKLGKPTRFMEWLEIFDPSDIDCFQEIMGYLLLPTTRGQKSFFLLGNGREGKSIWGTILYMLYGNAFTPVKVYELEDNRFTIATIEGKLVAYDDDMNHEKLKKTDNFKSLVTAKIPQHGERKGQDKFEFMPYARICACGNFLPSSLFDTSDGYFRRLLPIRVKNRPPDRKDISDFEKPMEQELEAIFRWSLVGLKRLILNDFQFSISKRSQDLLQSIKEESNSILDFIDERVSFNPKLSVTSEDLYREYTLFCERNGNIKRSRNSFLSYFKEHDEILKITYSKHLNGGKRGFVGMTINRIDLDKMLGGMEND